MTIVNNTIDFCMEFRWLTDRWASFLHVSLLQAMSCYLRYQLCKETQVTLLTGRKLQININFNNLSDLNILQTLLTSLSRRVGCFLWRYAKRVARIALNKDTIACKAPDTGDVTGTIHYYKTWDNYTMWVAHWWDKEREKSLKNLLMYIKKI